MYWKLENLLKSEIDPAYSKRARLILSNIEENRYQNILEVGSGRGFYLYACTLFSFTKKIVGIEINPKYIEIAKKTLRSKKVKLYLGSVYQLPFKNSEFDCVICSEVLEHLGDENKALLEIRRVLKKSGKLLVSVPNIDFPASLDPLNWSLMRIFKTHVNKDIWWLAGIWADHLRLYKDTRIEKLFVKNKFKLKNKVFYIKKSLIFSHFILYGLGKNLVEKLSLSSFNRFNYQSKKISKFLAKTLQMFVENDDKEAKSVGIFYELVK